MVERHKGESDSRENGNLRNQDSHSYIIRLSRFTSRNPGKCLIASFIFAIALSAIGIIVGGFEVTSENVGWQTRGTSIADMEMQAEVLNRNMQALFKDRDGSLWEMLKTKVSKGSVDLGDRDVNFTRRLNKLAQRSSRSLSWIKNEFFYGNGKISNSSRQLRSNKCDSWYEDYSSIFMEDNVYAVWKVQPKLEVSDFTALDKPVLLEICKAEAKTLQILEENKLCETCDEGGCSRPHSLILLLRDKLKDYESSCDELLQLYSEETKQEFTNELLACTKEYKEQFDSNNLKPGSVSSCPRFFQPSLIDYSFGETDTLQLRFTSSFFHTSGSDIKEIYNVYNTFDRGDSDIVSGVYETSEQGIYDLAPEMMMNDDMMLAIGSIIITVAAMLLHSKSAFLTLFGLLQILFSIPMAYFFYTAIVGIKFFHTLNTISIFVAAALGADDFFVAVDKFKNARIDNPAGRTEDIAQSALPSAGLAMFLTTCTTMVAFFSTCICPVTTIFCFAVFCGLSVTFNYILVILFVFPSLCLYDTWLQGGNKNFLLSFGGRYQGRTPTSVDEIENPQEHDIETNTRNFKNADHAELSLIHRILSKYYTLLHQFRYIIFGISIVGTFLAIIFALQLPMPDSLETKILPDKHPIQLHVVWKQSLLFKHLFTKGSNVQYIFGLKAGDTGNLYDPNSLTQLLVDEDFEPRKQEMQEYLKGFCDRLWNWKDDKGKTIAYPMSSDYICPINSFDRWLQIQSTSFSPDHEYLQNCNSASSVPVSEDIFDKCIIAWSQASDNRGILQENGVVRVIIADSQVDLSFASSLDEQKHAWNNFHDFNLEEEKHFPQGWTGFISSSTMWWWLDTMKNMQTTAIGAVGIALGFSAIVVLFSSRSLELTLFSTASIAYVLAATIASVVGLGYELGFLEAITFAVLIGISCDFVIHLGHAYAHQESGDKEVRTKTALLHMGPSILAAAITTFVASLFMVFCKMNFFSMFGTVLLLTILHATVGTFVIYLLLCILFGPAHPASFLTSLLTCGRRSPSIDPSSNVQSDLRAVSD